MLYANHFSFHSYSFVSSFITHLVSFHCLFFKVILHYINSFNLCLQLACLPHYNLFIWINFILLCISPILFYAHKLFVDIFLELSSFFDQAFNMRPLKVVLLIHFVQVLLQWLVICDMKLKSNSMCKFIFQSVEGKVKFHAMINSSILP